MVTVPAVHHPRASSAGGWSGRPRQCDYAHTRVQRTGAALAVVMLLIGSTAGQYLLVHGPAWALPLAVLQRECLASAGIWCGVTFLIHAIRAAREPRDAPLPAWADPG